MINLLLMVARVVAESLPEVTAGRVVARTLAHRASLLGRASIRKRIVVRRVRRMGILDAAMSGIRRGATAFEEAPTVSPTRVLPGTPGEMPLSVPPTPERINVPPNAYPYTPIPQMYFQSNRFTQNVFNSNATTSPGPLPPPQQDPPPDPKLNNLIKADIASNVLSQARGLANSWLPHIAWEGVVHATGFKTTPTRTVVHYALAVAFGLIKQQRISSCSLVVDVDYETNHVTVAYISQAWWLTEIMSLSLAALNGTLLPPNLLKDLKSLASKSLNVASRTMALGMNPTSVPGVIELGKVGAQFAGDAVKFVLKAYQNVGRMLGPLGVYDMGDDTLYGGRASALLRMPIQPEPFASMQSDANGKPVPLLTRLPSPNPQPPVAVGTDPSAGYSLDLRSLVAQALYDPGVLPPTPDTNVSLPTVY